LVHPEIISHTASAFGLALPWSIPSGLTTITVQRHQQLADGCHGRRRQESNQPRRG